MPFEKGGNSVADHGYTAVTRPDSRLHPAACGVGDGAGRGAVTERPAQRSAPPPDVGDADVPVHGDHVGHSEPASGRRPVDRTGELVTVDHVHARPAQHADDLQQRAEIEGAADLKAAALEAGLPEACR